MGFWVGIDGGGTKTAAVLLNEARREVGRGFGGPCNIATSDDATLRDSMKTAVESALHAAGISLKTRFMGACAGVAGYTAKKRRADFERIFADCVAAGKHFVEPDYVIAYWGATEGEPGIVVIAGTGTAVYGRNRKGESARVDGRGYLLGDHGSAYSIGLWGLTSIVTATDHGEALGAFHEKLLAEIGCEDADDVVEWLYRGFSPSRVAELARPIGLWADAGEPQAMRLLEVASRTLASNVHVTSKRLGVSIGALPIYLLGGLWQTTPLIKEMFARNLNSSYGSDGSDRYGDHAATPGKEEWIRDGRSDAAFGAALMALGEARGRPAGLLNQDT